MRLAATGALLNALDFVDSNFDKEAERTYIMQVTCEATQCNTNNAEVDARVRKVAFECLVRIAASYYKYMGTYITDIFTISVKAARTDEEDVALQAIELWSTLCEVGRTPLLLLTRIPIGVLIGCLIGVDCAWCAWDRHVRFQALV